MMQSTICLPRFLNSLPLICIVHKIIKRSFTGCNVGIKVGGRGGQLFWQCRAKRHEDYGATNTGLKKHQVH